MKWVWCAVLAQALLLWHISEETEAVLSSSLLQMSPCPGDNRTASTVPCLALNNCSGNLNHNGCFLLVSMPSTRDSIVRTDDLQLPTDLEVWVLGAISVGVISLSGITGALLWPLINSPFYGYVMTSLIGIAVGSLTSTALFQLIPEAFFLKELKSDHDYLTTAFFACISIWLVFWIEGMSKIIFRRTDHTCGMAVVGAEKDTLIYSQTEVTKNPTRRTTGVAWMIILGDGLHNFIDGMSIGAGYTQSIPTGIGLSIAIACEEFPHELGDFAILLKSGMTLRRALVYNFLSACTAFVGLALGIVVGELEGAHYIFSYAGGLFLYISLTHLIPELKDTIKTQLKSSRYKAFIMLLLQNVGILVGGAVIFFITKYNDEISTLF